MGGLFGGSPPSGDTLLNQKLSEAGLTRDGTDWLTALPPSVDTAFHQALKRFGLAPEAEDQVSDVVNVHPPEDQFAQLQEPLREQQDDNPLPLPPKPRPSLARLDNVPMTPGQNARPYMHPSMVDKVKGFIDELRQNGVPATLNSAFRTPDTQAELHGNKNGGAAPGRSLHQAGYAIDLNWDVLSDEQKARMLQIAPKHGFNWGGTFTKSDPGHFYVDPFPSIADREEAIRATQEEFARKR